MNGNQNPSTEALTSLEADLKFYADYIHGMSVNLLDSGVSKFPIFVAYRDGEAKIGKPILQHKTLQTNWSINISLLEEFVKNNIVLRENLAEFRNAYKDPEIFMCVFVADPSFTGFIYMPFDIPEEGESDNFEDFNG